MKYKEYRQEIPINTVKQWSRQLLSEAHWEPIGWSGESKEPYRHWACYPKYEGILINMWKAISPSLEEDGITLIPKRVIMNLYSHGDSAWLHKDSDDSKDWTVIIFLNEFWDINWGGDFVLVEDQEILQSFMATPGKFVLFKSNILHACRPVSREAPFPRFSVAFQCNYDNNLQRIRQTSLSPVSSPL
jgi:hypothetical protein